MYSFTDKHAVTIALRQLLFSKHRHLARLLMDVFYDHFLALHWKKFSDEPLKYYCQKFYTTLLTHKKELPIKTYQQKSEANIAQD
mgnify:CR=1 FL=1